MRSVATALALALAILPSCATAPSVTADYDTTVDFGSWRTYGWAEAGRAGVSPLWEAHIRDVLESELAAAGYTVEESDPNFEVAYRLSFQDQTDYEFHTTHVPFGPRRRGGFGRPTHSWTRAYALPYRVGTLVLTLADVDRQSVAFEARSTERLDAELTPEERREHLRQVIRAMLDQIPAAATTGAVSVY